MTAPRRPLFGLTVYAEKYPTGSGTDILRYSEEDLTHMAEFREGRISDFGTIESGISDTAGEHFLAQATIQHTDTDHFWRERLSQTSTRYMNGRHAVIDALSREGSDAAVTKRIIHRGVIRKLTLNDGLGAGLILEELIGSEFGPAFLDRLINPRVFNTNIFPKASPDLQEQPVPQIYGEVSDKGATDPKTGANAEKGLCPGFDVGDFDPNLGGVPVVATLLPAPPGPTFTRVGSGGSHTWTFACSVRVIGGGRTELGTSTTVTDYPNSGAFTPSNGAIGFLAQYSTELQQYVQGIDLYVKDGGSTSAAPWHYVDAAGQMFDTGFLLNGDDSFNKPWNPAPTTNTAVIPATTIVDGTPVTTEAWGLIIFADSAVKGILQLFGSDGGPTAEADPKRVEWTMGAMNDVIDPTSANWPYATPYIPITGTDGVVEWFTGIFVRGPRLLHHREQRATIAANICGREDVGDGSGDTIDQAFRVWQHILCENIFSNSGKGYYSGTWVGIPSFADGVAAINTTSITAAELLSTVLMGTAKGYLFGLCLTKPMTLREFLRQFNSDFTSFSYVTEGRLCISLINTINAATFGTPLREDIDEVIYIHAPIEHDEWIENQVQFQFDWDADASRLRSKVEKLDDLISQQAYGINNKLSIKKREKYECLFVRDGLTARVAKGQRLKLFSHPIREIPVDLGASGLDVKLMTQYRISGYEGYGATGYSLQPALATNKRINPSTGTVRVSFWDLGEVLEQELGILQDSVVIDGVTVPQARVWGDGEQNWGDGELTWG